MIATVAPATPARISGGMVPLAANSGCTPWWWRRCPPGPASGHHADHIEHLRADQHGDRQENGRPQLRQQHSTEHGPTGAVDFGRPNGDLGVPPATRPDRSRRYSRGSSRRSDGHHSQRPARILVTTEMGRRRTGRPGRQRHRRSRRSGAQSSGFVQRNGRSSSIASVPSTIEPTTAAPVKPAVSTIWRVSNQVNSLSRSWITHKSGRRSETFQSKNDDVVGQRATNSSNSAQYWGRTTRRTAHNAHALFDDRSRSLLRRRYRRSVARILSASLSAASADELIIAATRQ